MDFIHIPGDEVQGEDVYFGRYTLRPGRTYLVHDPLADAATAQGWGRRVGPPDGFRMMDETFLRPHDEPVPILVVFAGFLGDAVGASVLFAELEKTFRFRVDVACREEILRDVLQPLGFPGMRVQFPIDADRLGGYAAVHTDLGRFVPAEARRSCWNRPLLPDLLSSHRLEGIFPLPRYRIPKEVTRDFRFPRSRGRRVGIALDSRGITRRFPPAEASAVVRTLLEREMEVHALHYTSWPSLEPFRSDPRFFGHTGMSVPLLAAWIRAMDLLLACDSFPAHLAHALGVPVVALMSATGPGIFSHHPKTVCLASEMACSPCGEVSAPCPRGYEVCRAFLHPSLSAARIADEVERVLGRAAEDR